MLVKDTIAIVKQTIPALQANGEALTVHFYKRMFAGNPEVGELFNPAHQQAGTQQKALAGAICAYAQYIDQPEVLTDALELIAQKHASLGIKPEHYPIVGAHLLGSIREVLGEAATDEVIDAWGQAYEFLAHALMRREGEIYSHHTDQHGWQGFSEFVVQKKQAESDTITSFYLRPRDGSALPWFEAGQYLSVRVPGNVHRTTIRNYSLSCHPGEPHYRISVKRESARGDGAPDGYVSNYLHDHIEAGDAIEVGPPCGDFTLQTPDEPTRPLVLISGGVGITPLLSMAHTATETQPARPIWFIHGAINGQTHAFDAEVRALAHRYPNLRVHVRYSDPTEADRRRGGHEDEGFIDMKLVRSLVKQPDADFYFCGPKPLMIGLYQGLQAWDVPASQIHYEFFGPAEELQAQEDLAVPAA